MTHRTYGVLFVSVLSLIAGHVGAKVVPDEAGVHSLVFEAPDGFALRYALDAPASGEAAEARPLVVALHYGFDGSRPFPAYYGRGFLERVVAPGLRGLGAYIVAPDSHGHHWADPDIVEPILALLDALAADPRIDGDRVVVTGYSMGGAGTWWYLANHGDRFAAGVPMAGRFRASSAAGIRGIPIHALHSRDDELIPIAPVRELIAALRERGQDARLTELEGITHDESPRYAEPLREVVVPWLRLVLTKR